MGGYVDLSAMKMLSDWSQLTGKPQLVCLIVDEETLDYVVNRGGNQFDVDFVNGPFDLDFHDAAEFYAEVTVVAWAVEGASIGEVDTWFGELDESAMGTGFIDDWKSVGGVQVRAYDDGDNECGADALGAHVFVVVEVEMRCSRAQADELAAEAAAIVAA
jgi:hypothetical protein